MVRGKSTLYTLGYFSMEHKHNGEGSPAVTTVVKCVVDTDHCFAFWETTGNKPISTHRLQDHLADEHTRTFFMWKECDKNNNKKRRLSSLDVSTSTTSATPLSTSSPLRRHSSTSLFSQSFSNGAQVISALDIGNSIGNSMLDTHDTAMNALIKFTSVCNLAFKIIEQPVFRNFIQSISKLNEPLSISRNRLQTDVLFCHDEMK